MDDVAIVDLITALQGIGVDGRDAAVIVCEAIKNRPYQPPPITPGQNDRIALLEFALKSSVGPNGWLDWQRLTDGFTKMPETKPQPYWSDRHKASAWTG